MTAAAAPLPPSPPPPRPPAPAIIIAHRGASADRPEHTLAAYRLAIAQGADFIEPDLVSTKDHVLVARHENEISGTTDVADHPEFASRKRTQTIDGEAMTGWFTEDFTLVELRTLRARERLPQLRAANMAFDGEELVPTLDEIIALAKAETRRTGRTIGIYPETKHPSHFRSLGLALEPLLLAALKKAGWTSKSAPVFIQSFEIDNLKALHGQTGVRLIQLIGDGRSADGHDYAALLTPQGLTGVAAYAAGIGPEKSRVIPRDAAGNLLAPTGLVADAHAAGLQVHPWTFRPENYFLPLALRRGADPRARGDAAAEIRLFLEAGIDGVFSDSPAAAVAALGGPPA
ncbi:glycerophosphodiester phosphodiesterase [Sandarakinorhabdus sp.]|uniref:glycerophosphodiester phosphodiesterase n=1 Tax=Sandarakinorhabdus sp. TaxID=1916663 RepID=UPI00286E3FF9|nr:glycerophosphodiester phosphodiesterase [Sandarakinorhabdus sp.]